MLTSGDDSLSRMMLGWSNWPIMLASLRNSRLCCSEYPAFRLLMATWISLLLGSLRRPLQTSPNSPGSQTRAFTNLVYIYIYAVSSAFIQSELQCIQAIHFFISMCVPWEFNPQPFLLLMQCSHWATSIYLQSLISLHYNPLVSCSGGLHK